jgi:uncharacterized ferritin-like protein (DUF455 family)
MESVFDAAYRCLMAAAPAEKLAATQATVTAWREGRLALTQATTPVERIEHPGRPSKPQLVSPRQLHQRGLGSAEGRAALIHAIAHIEFNAIDLAWDAVYRFRDMPSAFYDDWIGVAADEARHFALLVERLADYGHVYGDFDAHNGLWEMAVRTDEDCLLRMALVPRVLEARGLDVTPGMIERLRSVGDLQTVAVLEVILREEVAHVAAGTRWFQWCCQQRGLDPVSHFDTVMLTERPVLKKPFNHEARLAAGFTERELQGLARMVAA